MCRPKTTFNPIATMFTADDFKAMSTFELYDIQEDIKDSAYKIIHSNKHYWGVAKCLDFIWDLNAGYYSSIKTALEYFKNTQSKEFLMAYLDVLETIKNIEKGGEY